MDLKYLKKLQPILNRVGKRHNIPINEGEFILGWLFKSFRNALTDPRMPKVMLPNIGTFKVTVTNLYRSLRRSIQWHRHGATTRKYINNRIAYLWAVRNRLLKEANGEITWKEHKKPEVREKFKRLLENEQNKEERGKGKCYGTEGESKTGVSRSRHYRKESKRILKEIYGGLHKADE